MSVKDRQRLKEELERRRAERAAHRQRAGGRLAPLGDADGPRAGAFADDDPELHRRFAAGEFDEELIGSFIDD